MLRRCFLTLFCPDVRVRPVCLHTLTLLFVSLIQNTYTVNFVLLLFYCAAATKFIILYKYNSEALVATFQSLFKSNFDWVYILQSSTGYVNQMSNSYMFIMFINQTLKCLIHPQSYTLSLQSSPRQCCLERSQCPNMSLFLPISVTHKRKHWFTGTEYKSFFVFIGWHTLQQHNSVKNILGCVTSDKDLILF